MKPVWSACVLFLYIYGIDKLLFTRAEVKTLDLSLGNNGNITCEDQAVIRIDNSTVHTYESYCASSINNECVLSDDDLNSIVTRCNNNSKCTVDYPKNTSCLKEDRYFNLSYSCLAPTNLLCTFEYSFCGWENMSDGLQWKRYSTNRSSTTISDIPKIDHTTQSQYGFYIYLRKVLKARKSILKSKMISLELEKCLVLRYTMDNTSTLMIYKNSARSTPVWQSNNTIKNVWFVAYIPLYRGQPSELVIEGMVGDKNDAYIALDDIDIQDWDCNEYLPLVCNFEDDLCRFEVQPEFGLRWHRSSARNAVSVDHTTDLQKPDYIYTVEFRSCSDPSYAYCQWQSHFPPFISSSLMTCVDTLEPEHEDTLRRALISALGVPHKVATYLGYGFYVYSESLNHEITSRRRIIISFDKELEVRCLTLWYYIYGDIPGHLYIYTNKNAEILSYIVDDRTTVWRQFQGNIYKAKQIILEHNFTSANRGGIALDDIYISPIICSGEQIFSNECIEKEENLHMDCPVSDVLNKVMLAFDPNTSLSCRNTTNQIEKNLNEIHGQCIDTDTCGFTIADLIDAECFDLSNRLQLMYSCIAETTTVISTSIQDSGETSTSIFTSVQDSGETSTSIFTSVQDSAGNPIYTIIIVSVLVIVLTAFGIITVVCYRMKNAKLSQHIGTRQDETANDMTDSTDYTAINYNEMRDIDISKINENKKDKITTHHDLQGNKASIEKVQNNCNKYESLATIRNPGEHMYELGCAHDNQYQSLTNQRELDEHAYETTEHASVQYQSLTNRSESDYHAYESTSIHTDVLQNKK